MAVLAFAAVSNAQSVDQKLKWVRETIDAHAVTSHFAPPATSTGTKWQVTRIEGCTMELKETSHRELPDSIVTRTGLFGLSEDRVSTWTFDLANLRPQLIIADSIGGPRVGMFGESDAFHFKTDVVSRTMRNDGTTVSTNTWSAPGSVASLWIYFDSPDADNNRLIKRVESDLQSATVQCVLQSHSR